VNEHFHAPDLALTREPGQVPQGDSLGVGDLKATQAMESTPPERSPETAGLDQAADRSWPDAGEAPEPERPDRGHAHDTYCAPSRYHHAVDEAASTSERVPPSTLVRSSGVFLASGRLFERIGGLEVVPVTLSPLAGRS